MDARRSDNQAVTLKQQLYKVRRFAVSNCSTLLR